MGAVHRTPKERRIRTLRLGYALLIVAALIYAARAISLSLFMAPPERLNVVYYSDRTYLYSLGITNGIHYVMPFPSDVKAEIPGGYGKYRIGAIGKLIGLDKDPTILKKAFTYNSASFVPYYFYPQKPSIYYDVDEEGTYILTPKDIFTSNSNASFLDKLYIYSKFLTVSHNDFVPIDISRYAEKTGGDMVFSAADFRKKFIGYFYNKTYRTERLTVQIIYTEDYDTAVGIGRILEGNGIRVVDISRKKEVQKRCMITEGIDSHSQTAKDLAHFFGCARSTESNSLSDIVFTLGSLESEWEIAL